MEAAVLIQAVAAGESALGQTEGAGVPEVQAVQALAARDVGMAAQDDRARGKTRQRRGLRQTVAVAGEDAQGVGLYPGVFRNGEGREHDVHFGVAVAAYGRDRAGQMVQAVQFFQHGAGVIAAGQGVARTVVDQVAQQHQHVGRQALGRITEEAQAVQRAVQVGSDEQTHGRP